MRVARVAARRVSLLVVLLALVPGLAGARHRHEDERDAPDKPAMLDGLGTYHHPIATKSAEAQRWFDQGLRLVYAFNHEEAVRSFKRAGELDPRAVMPRWGVALALGPNINMDVDPEREKAAYDAVEEARGLARDATAVEREYVEALARRYSKDPKADLKKLAVDYHQAMGALVARHPDDLDAATLYAESGMDLRPWQLWNADGTPAEGTEEIVAVLESVLARDPQHPGANHYLIHALEASPHPERALPSAARLESLMPGAGHLVHMPAHVYMRTGDYGAAVRANTRAVAADRAYFDQAGPQPMYGLMYFSHNHHFLAAAAVMAGRCAEARRAADDLMKIVRDGAASASHLDAASQGMLDILLPTPGVVALRCARWEDALAVPAPPAEMHGAEALWHFARGVAFVRTGKRKEAEAERTALAAARAALPANATLGFNPAAAVLEVARLSLDARLAARDSGRAVDLWRHAVAAEDALAYDEPADWLCYTRESLGAALLRARRPAEAEAVFRAELARHPRSGRALFGLTASLEAEHRGEDAAWVKRAYESAWRDADLVLERDDL